MAGKHTFRREEAIIPRSIEIGHSEDRLLLLLYIDCEPIDSLTLALPVAFARRHSALLAAMLREMDDSSSGEGMN